MAGMGLRSPFALPVSKRARDTYLGLGRRPIAAYGMDACGYDAVPGEIDERCRAPPAGVFV